MVILFLIAIVLCLQRHMRWYLRVRGIGIVPEVDLGRGIKEGRRISSGTIITLQQLQHLPHPNAFTEIRDTMCKVHQRSLAWSQITSAGMPDRTILKCALVCVYTEKASNYNPQLLKFVALLEVGNEGPASMFDRCLVGL